MNTEVTINPRNGHNVSKTGSEYWLNGRSVRSNELPDWYLSGDFPVTYVFGEKIEFNGGPCPVGANDIVRCFFRDGKTWAGAAGNPVWEYVGQHPQRVNEGRDIVAYQVEVG